MLQQPGVLRTEDNDFAEALDFCKEVEEDFRPSCYRHLGYLGAGQSIAEHITDEAQTGAANMLCALGEDHETRSNCVVGAVRAFIHRYRGNEQALAFCESFDEAELRAVCLRAAEEPYEEVFRPFLGRRRRRGSLAAPRA